MASTGAAIISAQGDTTGSVWAFRQTQIPGGGGGGGGGVTSVVQGSGITVTSSGPGGTGAVTVAATGGGAGVTSLAVAGGGIATSGSTGAITLTVPLGTNEYQLDNFNVGTPTYIYLGRWVTPNIAGKLHITVRSCADYKSMVIDNQVTDLYMVTAYNPPTYLSMAASFDSVLGSGYGGGVFVGAGPPNAPFSFTAVAPDTPTLGYKWDIYCLSMWYANKSYYTINVTGDDTWTHAGTPFGTTAPTGVQVNTCNAVAKASVWSKFKATQDVQLDLNGLNLAFNDGFQYIKYQGGGINGPEIAGGNGGRLIATGPGPSPIVIPALTWTNANVTHGGTVTFPNGGPNINTFNAGTPAINYCDLNAAPGTGGVASVVRIAGQSGSQIYLQPATIGFVTGAGGNFDFSKAPRFLLTNPVQQPVIQYGTNTAGTGISGTVVQTIPEAYSLASTYVVQVTMRDAPTAQLYATPLTANTFTIGWSSAGGGAQAIMWTTFGT